MNYLAQQPSAVFLGPSLAKSYAATLFAANYYPPARMGDIYRLLGTGVQIILLIDGIFHTTASVWQREILEALDNGIQVIGASSMGALRAAELYPLGMVGHGAIFEWYRNGLIVSDDEVVLLHADEEHNFQALSEPLVNIRRTLQVAVIQKCIDMAQATALIDHAKHTYYVERSYTKLLNSEVVMNWPKRAQAQLARFIKSNAVNLKAQDTIGALKYCATLAENQISKSEHPLPATERSGHYASLIYRKRGFFHPEGRLVSGELVLAEALKDVASVKTIQPILIKNYFLSLWAKQHEIICPIDYLEAYRHKWENGQSEADKAGWLQANGLTEREFQVIVAERALLAWIVEQGPTFFGLDFRPYTQFIAVMQLDFCFKSSDGATEPDQPSLQIRGACQQIESSKQASEIYFLTTWARENGIVCPVVIIEDFIKYWEATYKVSNRLVLAEWACVDWLIEKGPSYFGYISWSFEVALLRELQVTGQVARIVRKLTA